MILKHFIDVPLETITADGAAAAKIRWLISQKDGAPTFALRMFEIEPGGHTPYHTHNWEHEAFILQGNGVLINKNGETSFHQWDSVFVKPDEAHQFKNTGEDLLRFLCIIPNESPQKNKSAHKNPLADGPANNC